ncbi:MAG: cobalamin-dependent protein [Lentisphaerae bacterium]|nr:cobalamin-dependent protein [Lentisphaerota bacterium]
MRILLIATNTARTPYPIYPLGLSIIDAVLKREGHEVQLFDFLQNGESMDALRKQTLSFSPELIGMSIRNIDNVNLLNEQRYIDVVKYMIKLIREISDAKILLGGSGFSLMPDRIMDEVGADFGICGEGEQCIVEFAANAAKGIYPKTRCMHGALNLIGDDIPSAHYDPITMRFYLQSGNIGSVQTKRGCPYSCIYCTYPVLEGPVIRPRNPESVVNDVEELINKHGAKYIFFTDSVFNDFSNQHMAVVRTMKKRNLTVPWTAFFKPRDLNEEQVALMKETGLHTAEIGADAPSDTTLRGLGKTFLFEDVVNCNNLLRQYDVATAHYFMFGCPDETTETVLEGITNIKALKETVSFIFMGIRIIPNTKLEQIALREGILKPNHDMLTPIYYISPNLNKAWLETTLTEAFAGSRNCIFPPDAMEQSLSFLHKMGHSGAALDLLAKPARRTRHHTS